MRIYRSLYKTQVARKVNMKLSAELSLHIIGSENARDEINHMEDK